MECKYIDFPINKNGNRDLSQLKEGDSLEVRINELGEYQVDRLFHYLSKFDEIVLKHIKTKDAYGYIQLFQIQPRKVKNNG